MMKEDEVKIKNECDICGEIIDKKGNWNVCLRCGSTLCGRCDENHDCLTGAG